MRPCDNVHVFGHMSLMPVEKQSHPAGRPTTHLVEEDNDVGDHLGPADHGVPQGHGQLLQDLAARGRAQVLGVHRLLRRLIRLKRRPGGQLLS